MNWYYAKNGHQNGPLPTEDMIDRIAMGEIAQSDLAWCEGMGDWLPVAEIPQLKVEAPVKAEMHAAPASSPYQAPTAKPAPVSHQMVPGQLPAQGLAIASLVCGIVGLIGCCLWYLSLPVALAAIVTGHLMIAKIKADPQRFAGKGMARAGLILGYLGVICSLVAAVIWFNFRGLTVEQQQEKMIQWFPESMQRDMREQLRKQNESR